MTISSNSISTFFQKQPLQTIAEGALPVRRNSYWSQPTRVKQAIQKTSVIELSSVLLLFYQKLFLTPLCSQYHTATTKSVTCTYLLWYTQMNLSANKALKYWLDWCVKTISLLNQQVLHSLLAWQFSWQKYISDPSIII